MTTEHVADVPCEPTTGAPPYVHVVVRDGRVELLTESCFLTSEQALRVASALIRAVRATDLQFENRNTETMLGEVVEP
jgi:hypothetical protein